ncbi:MAG: transposase [Salinivirgaceae bacterium]|jgi:transposase|nr:transposase [Salinivirgaceae bacterium]
MKTKRRKFSSAFKAKVAIEALKEKDTLSELCEKFEVHATMISKWKQEFINRSPELFETTPPKVQDEKQIDELYTKIGKLEVEREWLKKNLKKAGL